MDEKKTTTEPRSLRVFLEQAAPAKMETVKANVVHRANYPGGTGNWAMTWPVVSLYCSSKICGGDHLFDPDESSTTFGTLSEPTRKLVFATYICRHCKTVKKIYALAIQVTLDDKRPMAEAFKFGEDPPAIGPTPRAMQDLLGEHWSLFLQGRRSELAGLGIGAFVYYRRVVEMVWQRVLERLVQVAKLDGQSTRTEALEAARKEEKFTRSMELAKGSIPGTLYVDGHNPFQALYDACGDGVHEYSDEECIRRSQAIRLILSRFSERAKLVLSEDAEFRQAVGALASKTDS